MQIIPAILPHSYDELVDRTKRLSGLVSCVQVDLCDGVIGADKTWLPNGDEELSDDFQYEFDIMVADWKTYVERCVALGAKRITVHVDLFSDIDCQDLLNVITDSSIWIGLAISNETPISKQTDLIKFFRDRHNNMFIQVMGIKNIGKQGEPFDDSALLRIKELKTTFPDLSVQVDGGIKPDTAKKIKEAGADVAIVGSYIFTQDSVEKALEDFRQ